MKFNLEAVMQWLNVLQQVEQQGAPLFAQIKAVLSANGVDADTAALDEAFADAERRKALAEAEASADPS